MLPRHIAIVMDGNGRWASARGGLRSDGHRAGLAPVRMAVRECARRGIEALTVFAFSSENWARPAEEVEALMSLFFNAMEQELPELQQNHVRLRFIGERVALAAGLRERMERVEQGTAHNRGLKLQVALNYGGRQDILGAVRQLAARAAAGTLPVEQISEQLFGAALALGQLPEPDLFIRTGGEQRISNFLLWNLAYSELYFTEVLWPDFDTADFEAALAAFAQRQRRFGLTGEQVGTGI
ncbi:MAG: polyprenyl diphosphate synthase [Steroidobacteraceae bacterium]